MEFLLLVSCSVCHAGLEKLKESTEESLTAVRIDMVLDEASDPDEVMTYLQKHVDSLQTLQATSAVIVGQQTAFGLPEATQEELREALQEVRPTI